MREMYKFLYPNVWFRGVPSVSNAVVDDKIVSFHHIRDIVTVVLLCQHARHSHEPSFGLLAPVSTDGIFEHAIYS